MNEEIGLSESELLNMVVVLRKELIEQMSSIDIMEHRIAAIEAGQNGLQNKILNAIMASGKTDMLVDMSEFVKILEGGQYE